MLTPEEIEQTRISLKCKETQVHGVFFTDGGCRPNPGIGGWGLHGYLYTNDVPTKGHGCKGFCPTDRGYVNLPTDAEYNKVSVLKYIDGSGSQIPESTNNRAELQALNMALDIAIKTQCVNAHFVLDSEYVLKGIGRIPNWVSANWKNADRSDVANNDLWRVTDGLLSAFIKVAGIHPTFAWTKGHSDSVGNNVADSNATKGIIAGRKGNSIIDLEFSDIKGYWHPDVDRHPFLSETCFYFKMHDGNHHKTKDGRTIYFTGNHGNKDEWFGKADPETSYSVSFLAIPDPVLETIRDLQNKEYHSIFASMVIAKLNNIFNPKVWRNIATSFGTYVQRMGPKIDLYTHDEIQLTKEMRPPQQSFEAESEFVKLETILNNVVANDKSEHYPITDITDLIYETDTSKKKPIRKTKISMEDHAIEVMINHTATGQLMASPVTLALGIDLPRRNTFSGLAERNSKVYLVSWKENALAFRYATIVTVDNDIAIWAGVYGNLRLVTSK